jgi:hypothetical protein
MEEKGFWLHEFDADELYKSEFVKTPCRKLVRFDHDLTDDFNGYDFAERLAIEAYGQVFGAFVRTDLTVWQDEAAKIDKETIKQIYISAGAIDADIRLIRKPRQTVRSESVLKSETLRDKIVAMAALNDETVPESILQKADKLENEPAIELVRAA